MINIIFIPFDEKINDKLINDYLKKTKKSDSFVLIKDYEDKTIKEYRDDFLRKYY